MNTEKIYIRPIESTGPLKMFPIPEHVNKQESKSEDFQTWIDAEVDASGDAEWKIKLFVEQKLEEMGKSGADEACEECLDRMFFS